MFNFIVHDCTSLCNMFCPNLFPQSVFSLTRLALIFWPVHAQVQFSMLIKVKNTSECSLASPIPVPFVNNSSKQANLKSVLIKCTWKTLNRNNCSPLYGDIRWSSQPTVQNSRWSNLRLLSVMSLNNLGLLSVMSLKWHVTESVQMRKYH